MKFLGWMQILPLSILLQIIDVSTGISISEEKPRENNTSIENYRELPLSKQKCKTDFDCREILKQLKSLTIIITDTAALKKLKENLIDVRDKF